MEEQGNSKSKYVDIGEGISLKVTKDAEFTLVNNETGKSRTFVSSDGILLADDGDIDFKAIDEAYGNRRYKDKFIRYGFHRWSNFKDGVCRLYWVIYPDGRYFADSDGYGMEDNDEERVVCTIDRNFDIIEPFRPEDHTPAETNPTVSVNTSAKTDYIQTGEIIDSKPTGSSKQDSSIDIMDILQEKMVDTDEEIRVLTEFRLDLEKAMHKWDSKILMERRFEIKQFGNVAGIRIGRFYTLVNLENGKSRMLVNKKGRLVLNEEENPLGQQSEEEGTIYAEYPVKCVHVSETGISLIEVVTLIYDEDHEVYDPDGYPLFYPKYYHDFHYCLLDQDFNVVFPVSHIENPREFCDSWPDIPTKENRPTAED